MITINGEEPDWYAVSKYEKKEDGMTKEEIVRLQELIITSGELCNRQFSDAAVVAMTHDLKQYPFMSVAEAIIHIRKSGRFPSILEIENFINPAVTTKQDANVLATRMLGAVSKYGWVWSTFLKSDAYVTGTFEGDFRIELGDVAFEVVKMMGGWSPFCESVNNTDPGQMKAQLRDLIDSVITKASAGTLDQPIPLPLFKERGNLLGSTREMPK